jgi:hypothetical protein
MSLISTRILYDFAFGLLGISLDGLSTKILAGFSGTNMLTFRYQISKIWGL